MIKKIKMRYRRERESLLEKLERKITRPIVKVALIAAYWVLMAIIIPLTDYLSSRDLDWPEAMFFLGLAIDTFVAYGLACLVVKYGKRYRDAGDPNHNALRLHTVAFFVIFALLLFLVPWLASNL